MDRKIRANTVVEILEVINRLDDRWLTVAGLLARLIKADVLDQGRDLAEAEALITRMVEDPNDVRSPLQRIVSVLGDPADPAHDPVGRVALDDPCEDAGTDGSNSGSGNGSDSRVID